MSTEKKSPQPERPQLTVDELHQLRWLLGGGVTLVSAWSMLYLEIEARALMGIITLAVVAGWIWPRLPARVPAFVHTFAFPLIVAFFLGDIALTGDALPAIVRLDMLLLLYRGISFRQRRDDLQIIVLGLFLIVVAGVLTVSMVFAVQLLAFAACALGLLLVVTLLQGMEDPAAMPDKNATPSWTEVEWRNLFVRVRRATDWRVAVLGGLLFVGVLAISVLLFVLIPRFQLENSLFLERFIVRKARTGFSDSIKFGDVTAIQQDATVALSVDVSDRNQIPASAYWRMVILDEYAEGRFKLSGALGARFGNQETDGVIPGPVRRGPPVYWTFYLESGVSRYLPLLGAFRELRFTELQSFRFHSALGVIALRDEPATMTAYRVEAFDLADSLRDSTFAEAWAQNRDNLGQMAAAQRSLLQVGLEGLSPADRRTLASVADEISATPLAANRPRRVTVDFIERTTGWLRRNHGYSLAPRVPPGAGDPLVRWLTSREGGHCELFAGSLVLLARAAGFPARVVVGFRGGSWNGYSNNLTLRNSDAHAWAEVFDEEQGAWLRADALALPAEVQRTATGDAPARVQQIDRGWSARIESLRIFWYRRVVNFDVRAQVETLKAIKEATENSGRQLREALLQSFERLKAWWNSPWDALRMARWLALLLAVMGCRWAWREFGRASWAGWLRPKNARQTDPVRVDAGRWLARIASAEKPEPASEAAEVVEALQRLRFGARASWPAPRPVFRRAKRMLREARRNRPRIRASREP